MDCKEIDENDNTTTIIIIIIIIITSKALCPEWAFSLLKRFSNYMFILLEYVSRENTATNGL